MGNDIDHISKTYFVLAPSYHGATLLSLLLGNHTKIAALGDTFPTSTYDQVCGCGNRVSKCGFWQQAISQVDYKRGTGDLQVIPRFARLTPSEWLNNRYGDRLVRMLWKMNLHLSGRGGGEFIGVYERFISFVLDYYGKQVFIDGGKQISRLLTLLLSGRRPAGIIHLTRSPLAFVASGLKRNNSLSIDQWISVYEKMHNEIAAVSQVEGLKYYKVNYEELTSDASGTIGKLFDFIGVCEEDVLRPIHSNVHWHGNQSLFKFDGKVYVNEKWRSILSEEQVRLIKDRSKDICEKLGYEL